MIVFVRNAIGSAGDPHGNAGRSSFTFFRGILRKECEESVTICVYVHNTFLNYAAAGCRISLQILSYWIMIKNLFSTGVACHDMITVEKTLMFSTYKCHRCLLRHNTGDLL